MVYVAPLRNDVEPPYIASEYLKFKDDIENLSKKYGATYVNFEGLVPPKYWGEKSTTNLTETKELDFMHFQAGGHKILANYLGDILMNSK